MAAFSFLSPAKQIQRGRTAGRAFQMEHITNAILVLGVELTGPDKLSKVSGLQNRNLGCQVSTILSLSFASSNELAKITCRITLPLST